MTEAAFTTLAGIRAALRDLPGPGSRRGDRRPRPRNGQLTKPPGALGRLEDLAIWYCRLARRCAAADRGAAGRRSSPATTGSRRGASRRFRREVTAQMVANFNAGGAAINQLGAAWSGAPTVRASRSTSTGRRGFHPRPGDDRGRAGRRRLPPAGRPVDPRRRPAGDGRDGDRQHHLRRGARGRAFRRDADATGSGAAPGSTMPGWPARRRSWPRAGASCATAGRSARGACAASAGASWRRWPGRSCGPATCAIPVILDGFICTAAAAVPAQRGATALDHCVAGHLSAEGAHAALARIGWASSRSCRWACGWAKGRARRWRSASCRRRWPVIRAWRPSPRPGSATR